MENETNTTSGYTPPDLSSGAGARRSRKWMAVVLIILVLVAGGVAAWLFMHKDKDAAQPTNTQKNTGINSDEQKTLAPFAVAFSSGDPAADGSEIRLHELTAKESTLAKKLGKGIYLSDAKVYRNKVAVVATAGADASGDSVAVWYSDNSGKSYEKVFSVARDDGGDSLGVQITSLGFSSDGKALVIGYLPEDGENTIKEIDPATKTAKDLFKVSDRGVFIQAYDRSAGKLYYYKGCYNCDGNKMNKLLVRHIKQGVENTVYEAAGKVGIRTVFNTDLSKVMVLTTDPLEDGLGYGADGIIEEVTIASGVVKTITPVTEIGEMGDIGYMEGEFFGYYVKGDTLYTLANEGYTQGSLYQADGKILQVLYVTENRAIVSVGDFSDFKVVDYDLTTHKTKELFKAKPNTYLFGLTKK